MSEGRAGAGAWIEAKKGRLGAGGGFGSSWSSRRGVQPAQLKDPAAISRKWALGEVVRGCTARAAAGPARRCAERRAGEFGRPRPTHRFFFSLFTLLQLSVRDHRGPSHSHRLTALYHPYPLEHASTSNRRSRARTPLHTHTLHLIATDRRSRTGPVTGTCLEARRRGGLEPAAEHARRGKRGARAQRASLSSP